MTKGLVSVVLPIYNVEKYIDCCVQSVVSQSYENLEIILVDDGSPDNCPQICDEWARRDKRIKVIHKQNEGLGMARNTGIENATGEYICFFDSDDYIARNTIMDVYSVARNTKADIVTFGYSNVGTDGKVKKEVIPLITKTLFEGEEVQKDFLAKLITDNPQTGEKSCLSISAWASFFSMDLIRRTGWRFVSEREIIAEDVYSMLVLYKSVGKVAVLPKALYFYRENSNSLSRSYRKDRFEKICFFYERCLEIQKQLMYGEAIAMRVSSVFVGFAIGAMKMIVSSQLNKKEKIAELQVVVNNAYIQKIIHELKWKHGGLGEKLLIMFMRHKWYIWCYILVKIRLWC